MVEEYDHRDNLVKTYLTMYSLLTKPAKLPISSETIDIKGQSKVFSVRLPLYVFDKTA